METPTTSGRQVSPTRDVWLKVRCKSFMKGRVCRRGSNCPFRHKWPWEDEVICKRAINGYCTLGTSCPYKHPNISEMVAIRETLSEKKVTQRDKSNFECPGEILESPEVTYSVGRLLQYLRTMNCNDAER